MICRFGIITDIHHTGQADGVKLLYSMALDRTAQFVEAMNEVGADFIVELGDMIDTLGENRDGSQLLDEVEAVLRGFDGPRYHVVGNHDFDGLARALLLERTVNSGIDGDATYYSFDHGGLHGVVLDACYTVQPPHRPFDRQITDAQFFVWQDAWVPAEELAWLQSDLAATRLPTVVFTHQLLHRDQSEDHTIKNAAAVRAVLEASGKVIAAFSGHDHQGEYTVRNNIHYCVLQSAIRRNANITDGNEMSEPAIQASTPYTLVEIEQNPTAATPPGTWRVTITQQGRRQQLESRLPAFVGGGIKTEV